MFLIQSVVKSPQALRKRIAAFLNNIKLKLERLTEKEYNTYIESVVTEYQQKPLQLLEEADRLWQEIKTQQYFFDRSIHHVVELI